MTFEKAMDLGAEFDVQLTRVGLSVVEIAPAFPYDLLYECRIAEPQRYANELDMQYLHPDYRFPDNAELTKFEAAGVKTNPWTVDREEDMRYLPGQKNLRAIMSDRAGVLMDARSAQ